MNTRKLIGILASVQILGGSAWAGAGPQNVAVPGGNNAVIPATGAIVPGGRTVIPPSGAIVPPSGVVFPPTGAVTEGNGGMNSPRTGAITPSGRTVIPPSGRSAPASGTIVPSWGNSGGIPFDSRSSVRFVSGNTTAASGQPATPQSPAANADAAIAAIAAMRTNTVISPHHNGMAPGARTARIGIVIGKGPAPAQ